MIYTGYNVQIQVQEVMCDNATLKRRLESLLADNQRKADLERDKLSSRVSVMHCMSTTMSIIIIIIIIISSC